MDSSFRILLYLLSFSYLTLSPSLSLFLRLIHASSLASLSFAQVWIELERSCSNNSINQHGTSHVKDWRACLQSVYNSIFTVGIIFMYGSSWTCRICYWMFQRKTSSQIFKATNTVLDNHWLVLPVYQLDGDSCTSRDCTFFSWIHAMGPRSRKQRQQRQQRHGSLYPRTLSTV